MNQDAPKQHTDDVSSDFDLYDVGELAAKSALVLKLNALIASRGLSEEEAAALAEMTRPVVTPEQPERLRNVSPETPLVTLASPAHLVVIAVRPSTAPSPGRPRLAA